jgi:hypothetical protein
VYSGEQIYQTIWPNTPEDGKQKYFFYPKNGCRKFLSSVDTCLPYYVVSHPRQTKKTITPFSLKMEAAASFETFIHYLQSHMVSHRRRPKTEEFLSC